MKGGQVQIAEALDSADNEGIIHRGIEPANTCVLPYGSKPFFGPSASRRRRPCFRRILLAYPITLVRCRGLDALPGIVLYFAYAPGARVRKS